MILSSIDISVENKIVTVICNFLIDVKIHSFTII